MLSRLISRDVSPVPRSHAPAVIASYFAILLPRMFSTMK